MFKNVKWLRLVPDRPGRGGMKTGIHTFQGQPVNDTRVVSGVYVHNGAWVREYTSIPIYELSGQHIDTCAPGFTGIPFAVHVYTYPDLLDPSKAPNFTVLGHNQNALFSRHIWDYTHGTVRQPNAGQGNQPAVFQNINGRCFVACGGGIEGVVLDDRTPAIHAQANQLLGVGAPTQALGATTPAGLPANPNLTPWGAAYMPNNHLAPGNPGYINTPNPNSPIGTIKTTDTVTVTYPNVNMTSIYVGGGIFPPAANPSLDGVSSNTTPFPNPGVLSITSGTSIVTLSGAGGVFPADFAYCGLAINFNGYSFVILDHGVRPGAGPECGGTLDGTIRAYLNTEALIGGVYNGPTLRNVPYTITGCQVKMPLPSTVQMNNSNPADLPPGTAFGYSQHTYCNTPQVLISAVTSNNFYRNLGNISLGPKGGGVADTVIDITMGANFNNLYSPSSPWTSSDVGKTIVIDHAGGGGTMLATQISQINGGAFATTTAPNGPILVTNKRAWWASNAVGTPDVTIAIGLPQDVTSPSNPWTINDVGKEIIIAAAGNVPAAGDALFAHIDGFTNPGHIHIDVAATAGVAAVQAYWGGAIANTTAGPTYAYAWYDPETGHCSNISPLYQVPRPTVQGAYSDFANLTPVFQIDPGSMAYPDQVIHPLDSPTDGIRFSHILFFRTLSTPGSSTLYPIGSLQPFVGKVHPGSSSTRGSVYPTLLQGWYGLPNSHTVAPPTAFAVTPPTYWYDFSSDSDLLLSGGFRAPQFTNSKPYASIKGGETEPGHPYQMEYWDRRLWIVNAQEPNKIAFSCDDAQCPLGVPEESFPATNFLRLPADDGTVQGMKKIGDMLLITTERWAYIIAGNNESNYRLLKVSSFMPGVGTYQMAEFPTVSGMQGEPSTIFFLGRDKKVYQWTMGGQVIPISGPIQDQLDAADFNLFNYQRARVHTAAAWGRRVLVVGLNVLTAVGTAGLVTYIWDIDNQVWTLAYRGVNSALALTGMAPMCTAYGIDTTESDTDTAVVELYAIFAFNGIQVRNWLRTNTLQAQGPVTIETFPLTFDGKKTRKMLQAVNLHVTASAANAWGLTVINNESQDLSFTAFFGPYPDPLDSVYGTNPVPVDSSGALDLVLLNGEIVGQPLVFYRSIIRVISQNDTPAKIYAIDIAYTDEENPGEGDA